MSRQAKPKRTVGSKLNSNLTILGIVDGGSVEPVYIVWHHRAWCPMACKVFNSLRAANSEAETLRRFAHPGIVRVFGVEQPGCLLMPFLEGPSLANLIDRAPDGRLGIANTLRVAIHVGAALAHIHDRGYAHLDVKPTNVIVTRGGQPIMFDFGTVRRASGKRIRSIVGTNEYIAPEICRLEQAGSPADVFSLGVMIFEMLTGELPFAAGSQHKSFPQAVDRPARLRMHRPGISAALESIVLACLEDDPAKRPPLARLLPALNAQIRRGAPMWPSSFDPMV